MTVEDFFITEDFTTPAPAKPATETVEQGTLFDACTYAGPTNRRGVENVAAIDAFGNLTV
jgi:hypothetical protein